MQRVPYLHQRNAEEVLAAPIRLIENLRVALAESHSPNEVVGTGFDQFGGRGCQQQGTQPRILRELLSTSDIDDRFALGQPGGRIEALDLATPSAF
jgi:hypothetical protein